MATEENLPERSIFGPYPELIKDDNKHTLKSKIIWWSDKPRS